ncbi:tRNA (guanine(46)-N(7))-methyltransferase [hydrothermal vent metagenome]|uniref:tRNA (guanine(46)-N(7))-methyltransferase n=1 Tax=hydrothermal vent metagenome TaxID=652676 RepID=A0A3B1D6K9_9ZZZZ
MKFCSLSPLVFPHALNHPIDWSGQFDRSQKDFSLDVEIGFGMGEILMRKAQDFPEKCFVGIEQIWERIYKTMRSMTLAEYAFSNIRILQMDAYIVFERLFATQSINNVYCLFPCPWPKKKHVKHRLFSPYFLKLLNDRLKPKGILQIVTDSQVYFDWVLEQAEATGFSVVTNIIQAQFDTKFERKWKAGGQEEFFEIKMIKTEHRDIPVKEDVFLKGYKVNIFDPQKFNFSDVIGDVTIVLKQFLFDERVQSGEVMMLVSEQDMTQYFRVAIIKKESGWRICKAEGQVFFPTPGIAQALEEVYKKIKEAAL